MISTSRQRALVEALVVGGEVAANCAWMNHCSCSDTSSTAAQSAAAASVPAASVSADGSVVAAAVTGRGRREAATTAPTPSSL